MRRDKIVAIALAVAFIAGYFIGPAKAEGVGSPSSIAGPITTIGSGPWSGFYIGAHVGKGWGKWDGTMSYTDAASVPLEPYGAFDSSSHTINGDGTIAGGQIGFNVQSGSFVWGIEADASWANLEGRGAFFPYPDDPNRGTGYGTPGWGFAIENNWLATVRGRLGMTAGSVLFYGTGGVAFGGFSETHTVIGYPDPEGRTSGRDETKIGWTAGAGMEWALARNWSAKAEYLYLSFPNVGGTMHGWAAEYGPATDGFRGDWNVHSVRVGVNYRFGGQ